MTPEAARRNAQVAGAVTAAAGPLLLGSPGAARAADRGRRSCAAAPVGLSDVVLAPGLLLAPGRWPWLAARSAVDEVVGARLLREPTQTARATGVVLLALAVLDTRSAAVLRRTGG